MLESRSTASTSFTSRGDAMPSSSVSTVSAGGTVSGASIATVTSFNATVYPVVFSDERHDLEVRCGCVIADMLGDRHAVVLAAGSILQPDEYAVYKPSPGEDARLRHAPHAPVVAVIAALGTAF